MLITMEMMWNELQEIKKMVVKLQRNQEVFSIEEISLNRACKLLRLGSPTVIRLVRNGKLKSRVYRDVNRKLRYRFLLKDIKEFQDSNKYHHEILQDDIKTAEEIAQEIFHNHKRK